MPGSPHGHISVGIGARNGYQQGKNSIPWVQQLFAGQFGRFGTKLVLKENHSAIQLKSFAMPVLLCVFGQVFTMKEIRRC